MKKELAFKILIIIFIVSGLGTIGFYVYTFSGGLTNDHQKWAEFGSFIGGVLSPVVGILAFIGLFYNLDLTKKQFKKDNEDNTFFRMIDLHVKKVESTSFFQNDNTEFTSFHAFKYYTLEYNKMFNKEFSIMGRMEIASNYENLSTNAYKFLWEHFYQYIDGEQHYSHENEKLINFFEGNSTSDNLEHIKAVIGTEQNIKVTDYLKLVSIGLVVMMGSPSSERVLSVQRVHSFFYQEYGHILGHYFRNIHYILEFIDKSDNSIKYSKIFRAQLSRYELALIFYNSLSLMSSKRTVELIVKYDIINGIYSSDISYGPHKETIQNDLATRINNAP